MKSVLIPVLSFVICFFIFWKWTYGFKAFTIFTYTMNKAGKTPREFPAFQMIDQNSNEFNIRDKHKYVLINFVYLDCPYACHRVNGELDRIYHLFSKEIVPSQLEFVTVSFNPESDNINRLKNYRNNFGNDISGWTFGVPYHSDQHEIKQILREVGVWTYKSQESGIINHSLYLFLVSPVNKIIKIFDPSVDSYRTIIEQINECIKEKI